MMTKLTSQGFRESGIGITVNCKYCDSLMKSGAVVEDTGMQLYDCPICGSRRAEFHSNYDKGPSYDWLLVFHSRVKRAFREALGDD